MIRTDWLERQAIYAGDRTALLWHPTRERISYADLNAQGTRLAYVMATEFGLTPGDRVAVLAENRLAHVLLWVACQKAGFVLVPLNFRLTPPELQYLLDDSDPALLFADVPFMPLMGTLATHAVVRPLAEVHDFALEGLEKRVLPQPDPEAALMILYTSGTTGKPKGAVLNHRMIFHNAVHTAMRLDLTSKDVSFNAAPFYHTGGWNVLLTPFLLFGGTTWLFDRFDADALLQLCATEGITVLWGVPTMMRMLAESPHFSADTFSSVRYAIVGGEPMPEPLIRLYQEHGVPIRQGFGMTEVGVNCFSLPEEDALRKIGSIGTPNFFVETRVVNEVGDDVGPNQTGELLMAGPVVTPGYWNHPEATAQAIRDGWFHSGDLVRVDEEGYYYVVGRKKDMYISGGENVYPAEVEAVLHRHPAVHEVAIVGVPDARWGETGCAFVSLTPDALPQNASDADRSALADTLIAHCRDHLARYKVPKSVRFLSELPKGHSGKILKHALRDLS